MTEGQGRGRSRAQGTVIILRSLGPGQGSAVGLVSCRGRSTRGHAMKVGIFLTNQHPIGSDMVSALEEQYVMTRLARDREWDAVGTGQHYLSEGMSQLQLIPFLSRLAAEAG